MNSSNQQYQQEANNAGQYDEISGDEGDPDIVIPTPPPAGLNGYVDIGYNGAPVVTGVVPQPHQPWGSFNHGMGHPPPPHGVLAAIQNADGSWVGRDISFVGAAPPPPLPQQVMGNNYTNADVMMPRPNALWQRAYVPPVRPIIQEAVTQQQLTSLRIEMVDMLRDGVATMETNNRKIADLDEERINHSMEFKNLRKELQQEGKKREKFELTISDKIQKLGEEMASLQSKQNLPSSSSSSSSMDGEESTEIKMTQKINELGESLQRKLDEFSEGQRSIQIKIGAIESAVEDLQQQVAAIAAAPVEARNPARPDPVTNSPPDEDMDHVPGVSNQSTNSSHETNFAPVAHPSPSTSGQGQGPVNNELISLIQGLTANISSRLGVIEEGQLSLLAKVETLEGDVGDLRRSVEEIMATLPPPHPPPTEAVAVASSSGVDAQNGNPDPIPVEETDTAHPALIEGGERGRDGNRGNKRTPRKREPSNRNLVLNSKLRKRHYVYDRRSRKPAGSGRRRISQNERIRRLLSRPKPSRSTNRSQLNTPTPAPRNSRSAKVATTRAGNMGQARKQNQSNAATNAVVVEQRHGPGGEAQDEQGGTILLCICGRQYITKSGRRRHIRNKNRNRLQCNLCGRVFATKSSRNRHLRNVHVA